MSQILKAYFFLYFFGVQSVLFFLIFCTFLGRRARGNTGFGIQVNTQGKEGGGQGVGSRGTSHSQW